MKDRVRSQRDIDIIRQSSLKAAVDFATGVEDADAVLRVADKFFNWVTSGADPVQDAVKWVKETVEQVQTTHSEISQHIQSLKESIARDDSLYCRVSEPDFDGVHWFDRGKLTFGANRGDPYPISSKQFGYAIALSQTVGVDPDPRFLMGLSTKGASMLLDALKEAKEKTNGNGKEQLRQARQAIRERGIDLAQRSV